MASTQEPADLAAPVVIVGAGPVGMLAAILLAQRGIDSIVYERATQPSELPRAVHLDDEAQRTLQGAGLLDRLRPHLSPTTRYELRDRHGELLHAFARERAPLGHPPSVLFHQPDLERVLREAAESSDRIDLRWAHEVVAVEPGVLAAAARASHAGTGSPVVETRGPGGGHQRSAAPAVLGCDGAASTVRRLLGTTSTDLGFGQSWLVADLRIADRPASLAHPQQRCDPACPATSVPVGPDRHRFELMLPDGEQHEDVQPQLRELTTTWDVDLDEVEVERVAVYRFHALNADRWRNGGVFLLGDAAHQMPPFFGQGLCSGFRDAANLSWKLAMVLHGVARPTLLDTYEAERRPQVAETIRRTALLGKVITGTGPLTEGLRRGGAAALRQVPPLRRAVEELRPPPLPAGPLVDRVRGWGPAGHPFPQPELLVDDRVGERRDGRPARLADELLGDGFALVGWRTDPLAAADATTRRFWSALGVRSIRVDPPDAPAVSGAAAHDVTGQLERWFADVRGDVAVVRPDRVVLGAARAGDPRRMAALAARIARSI
jgi:3-(3-hydroxy-phenyl)propionate hydroxylase